jgi:hypothetical protein
MTAKLPEKEKLTIKWLLDHLPLSWWVSIGIIIFTTFSLGFTLANKINANYDIETIKNLHNTKQKLLSEIETLKIEEAIARANAARASNLSDESTDPNNRANYK